MLSGMQALFLIALFALAGAEVYRWTDANGVTHYSDRPHPGAERITIEAAPAVGSVAPPTTRAAPDAQPAGPLYRELAIAEPGQDEVLWNIEGQLDVAVTVEPPLLPGHQVQLLLDGRPAAILPAGTTVTRLSEVFRGTHTLAAEVLDEAGSSLIRTPPVTFHVRQTSIQNPVNPLVQPTPAARP